MYDEETKEGMRGVMFYKRHTACVYDDGNEGTFLLEVEQEPREPFCFCSLFLTLCFKKTKRHMLRFEREKYRVMNRASVAFG